MDIHRAHNHPSINSAVPGTRIEISIHDASCSQSVRVEISVAERAEIGQPEVADILDAFPTGTYHGCLLDGRNFVFRPIAKNVGTDLKSLISFVSKFNYSFFFIPYRRI